MSFREFTFTRGSRGILVSAIQRALRRNGWQDIAADGVLGPITLNVLRLALNDSAAVTFTAADLRGIGLDLVNTVDLSSHNEGGRKGRVNFYKLKAAGCGHVVIKLSEGATYFNDEAKRQFEEAIRVGMTVDAYHFLRPDIGPDRKPVRDLLDLRAAEADARLEVAWALRSLERVGSPPIGVMYGDAEKGVSAKAASVNADRFNGRHFATWIQEMQKVLAYQRAPAPTTGIYSARWFDQFLNDAMPADLAVIAGAVSFVASYNEGITPKRLPDLLQTPTIWQYKGKGGRVDGVDGDCDLGVTIRFIKTV